MPQWLLIMQAVTAAIQVVVPEIASIIKEIQDAGGTPTASHVAKLAAYSQAHQSLAATTAAVSRYHAAEGLKQAA
jgi:hypothetical protein